MNRVGAFLTKSGHFFFDVQIKAGEVLPGEVSGLKFVKPFSDFCSQLT